MTGTAALNGQFVWLRFGILSYYYKRAQIHHLGENFEHGAT